MSKPYAEPLLFDLHLPVSLFIDSSKSSTIAPLCSVLARISLTTGGRLRISVNGAVIVDRREPSPPVELIQLAKVDLLLGKEMRKVASRGMMIGNRTQPKKEDKAHE